MAMLEPTLPLHVSRAAPAAERGPRPPHARPAKPPLSGSDAGEVTYESRVGGISDCAESLNGVQRINPASRMMRTPSSIDSLGGALIGGLTGPA